MNETLQAKLDALPEGPGVYVFLDARGAVHYVGKSKNLRRRVRSYFQRSAGDGRLFFDRIVGETADLHVILTDTEKEAFLLENTLIKQNRPRHNLVFRDDKSYPCLRLTVGEEFPRLHVVRRVARDGARYFGPFDSAPSLRQTLEVLQAVAPLRRCADGAFRNRTRPCLQHEIGRCPGPCAGRISAEDYARRVREAVWFLEGKAGAVAGALRGRMRAAAAALRFEEAARLRDAARAVERTLERQKVAVPGLGDLDAFGLAREGNRLGLAVLFVRDGRVTGADSGAHAGVPDDGEALASALLQFYTGAKALPPEVLVPSDVAGADLVAEILSERRGAPVALVRPLRGPKRALAALACKNAALALAPGRRGRGGGEGPPDAAKGAGEVAAALGLPAPPRRIECFDVSHIQGSDAAGALAVLFDGKPLRSGYRRFRIRDAAPGDDFAAMGELVRRRFAPGKEPPPDLLLVDGGPPQLDAALRALREAGLAGLPVAGMAKERPVGEGRTPDRLHLPGRPAPVVLPEASPGLRLLQKARDEAHRFALRYHRTLRRGRTLRSGLEGIPGLGPRRRAALLRRFGSARGILEASEADLAAVPGVPPRVAAAARAALAAAPGGGADPGT